MQFALLYALNKRKKKLFIKESVFFSCHIEFSDAEAGANAFSRFVIWELLFSLVEILCQILLDRKILTETF